MVEALRQVERHSQHSSQVTCTLQVVYLGLSGLATLLALLLVQHRYFSPRDMLPSG
jgi:hypothetical protein